MLKEKFKILCQNFTGNEELISQLWEEIETTHSEKTRHYHTLQHLEQIFKELEEVRLTPLLEFAIFYHDLVYDATAKDNEKQSALLCEQRLQQLTVPHTLIVKITQLINETKTHETSSAENALFLDADLAILASKDYEEYTRKIRKEYAIFDDATYFKGRQKVLESLLEKKRIYKSDYFYERYEQKAHSNLAWELKKKLSD